MEPNSLAFGSRTVVSGQPRWKCKEVEPWNKTEYCWSFTKGEEDARVEKVTTAAGVRARTRRRGMMTAT